MATGLYSLSLCSVGFICCSTSKLTLIQLLHVCTCAQLCPTLCNRIDCSLPDFSVHGIFQAGILEQVDISYPGITLASLVLAGGFFTAEAPGKSSRQNFINKCLKSLIHKLPCLKQT